MKAVSAAVLLSLTLTVTGSRAQQFTTYGAGASSCALWTEHLKDKNLHSIDLQWVLGFVSAAGVFAGVQLKVGPNDIDPFITKLCQEQPEQTITTAAATLVGKLRQ